VSVAKADFFCARRGAVGSNRKQPDWQGTFEAFLTSDSERCNGANGINTKHLIALA